jgi:hypothetical protein
MDILAIQIPLWAIFIGIIIIIYVAWKLIKFAIKILIALLLFFGILIGLDMLGIFSWLQQFIGGF